MADISRVVNVALAAEGEALSRENMNVVAIFTSDTSVLSSSDRYRTYDKASSVAEDFGSGSVVTQFANVTLSQQPNPVSAGGEFYVAYWRAVDENVPATSASLVGEQITNATTIPVLQGISDGSFDIDVDGVTVNVTGLDFRTVLNLDEVAAILDTEIAGASVVYDNLSIKVTSDTTGATSTLTYLTAGASGTFVGPALGLDSSSGGTLTQGEAATVLVAETKVDALTAVQEEVVFKGFVFIDSLTDQEVSDVAEWAQANDALHYNVFEDETNLDIDPTNPVWLLKLSGQNYSRSLYSKSGNRKLAAGYMGRMHTVNFGGTNTAITMNLKELISVPAEEYTDTELTKAQNVGLDLYTTFGSAANVVEKLYTSGANDFTDNPYNLIAYVNAVQTDVFNLFGTTTTKIAQTQRGLNQIVGRIEQTTLQFVTANVFSPGEWTSVDFFGNIDTFKENIRTRGFYVRANSLALQPQSERQDRITPLIQVAVKNAGAFHQANILINFNI